MLDILTSSLVRFRRRMHPRFLGYGLALLSTATLSTAFVISKAALEDINSRGWFERSMGRLLHAAYEQRLDGIVELLPDEMVGEIARAAYVSILRY